MKTNPQRTQWTVLEHEIYRLWRENPQFPRGELIVGWSGGADSTCLLQLLSVLAGSLGCRIHAVTIHHGPGPWQQARDRALEFCRRQSEAHSWSWEFVQSEKELTSEAALRKWRLSALKKICKERGAVAIVLAHHEQDLLETRLMRLFRGTGPDGLPAMRFWRSPLLRPFLHISRKQILQQLRDRKLSWFEDPSNQDLGPMRNWIRRKLLPQIQSRNASWLQNMARSLELMAQFQSEQIPGDLFLRAANDGSQGICRMEFEKLPPIMRQMVLARYIKSLGVNNFTHSQIKEILKHLDKDQKKHSFRVAYCEWTVNAEQILARSFGNGSKVTSRRD